MNVGNKPIPPQPVRHRPGTILRAQGAYLWDADGTRYIDHVAGHGRVLVGHCDPRITAAASVAAASVDLTGVGEPAGARELEAVILRDRPGFEQAAFTGGLSAALLLASRLAQAATGRRGVMAIEGDGLMEPVVALAGCGPVIATVPWNDREALKAAVGDPIDPPAALVLEPAQQPGLDGHAAAGYLDAVRLAADRAGALLVFVHAYPSLGRQPGSLDNVRSDVAVLGDAYANGYPFGAVVGSAALLRPALSIRSSALSGPQPFALAAATRTIEIMEDGGWDEIERLGQAIRGGLDDIVRSTGADARVAGTGNAWAIEWGARSQALTFRSELLDAGVLTPEPSAGPARFPLATSDDDVEATLDAVRFSLSRAG